MELLFWFRGGSIQGKYNVQIFAPIVQFSFLNHTLHLCIIIYGVNAFLDNLL